MVAGTCKKRGTLRNAVPRLRTRWCSMLIAKAFRHLARRTSSLAILAITALNPFTVNFTGTSAFTSARFQASSSVHSRPQVHNKGTTSGTSVNQR